MALHGTCFPRRCSIAGFCRKVRCRAEERRVASAFSCREDRELLRDGWAGIVGIPRLSFAHHVDHLDPG